MRTYPWPPPLLLLPLLLPLLLSMGVCASGCVVAAESSIWAVSAPSLSCFPFFPPVTEPAAGAGAAASMVTAAWGKGEWVRR